MSVTQVPIHPIKRGSLTRLWLAIVAIVALAAVTAWMGAGQVRNVEVDTLAPGNGGPLTDADGLLMNYSGSVKGGAVFDSTQGQPVPMLVGQTIPGFRIALHQMHEGGHYKVFIPGRLAYGDHPPANSPIGPNEDLYFDIQVVKVVRNAAALAAQMEQQQRIQQMQAQGAGAPGRGLPPEAATP